VKKKTDLADFLAKRVNKILSEVLRAINKKGSPVYVQFDQDGEIKGITIDKGFAEKKAYTRVM